MQPSLDGGGARPTALSSQFRTDIARTEYLSNADERLRWQASSLPADDLCTENAIMLKRFNRYALVCPRGAARRFSWVMIPEWFLRDAFEKASRRLGAGLQGRQVCACPRPIPFFRIGWLICSAERIHV